MASPPLSTLLSQLLVAHTVELDNELEHRFLASGGGARVVSLTVWSNLLGFVGPGTSMRDLGAAIGLPRATLRSRLAGVTRWGYVRVTDDGLVLLTPAGERAAAIWALLPQEIERRWRERFGAAAIDELAEALQAIGANRETPLPAFLPIVSSTHGLALELEAAVPGGEEELPLVTLLAQALMAFTLDFEEASPLSLPLSANVVRVLGPETTPVTALPGLTGISKEAVEVCLTALRRTELVRIEGAPASKRTIRLTPVGASLRARQPEIHDRIEARWRERLGHGLVDRLRGSVELVLDHPQLPLGMTPCPEGWRASRPYQRQTQAVLADPRGHLPHHPMVLHRGGWPDGS